MSDINTVVIDNGSHTLKAGYAGMFEPRYVFRSQTAQQQLSKKHFQTFCGSEVNKAPENCPVKQVFIDENNIDWNGATKLWKYLIYDKMQLPKEPLNFFLTEAPNNSFKNRERTCEIMFETFQANGLYFGYTPSMILYATGRTTGTVIESRYLKTHICPIFEGYMLPLNHTQLNYGGATITQYLQSLLSQTQNLNLTFNECEYIKEKYCYVAKDYYEDSSALLSNNKNKTYKLPDKREISMSIETYKCCELLFQPKIANLNECAALPYSTYQTIMKCDPSLRKDLFSNIILGGGNSMLRGIKKRLHKSIVYLSPASLRVDIQGSPQRKYGAFTGASILANQSQINDVWVTKEMFREYGANVVAVRCF